MKKLKLNLGCGGKILPNYINIDTKVLDGSLVDLDGIVVAMDVTDLKFSNESVDEILAESVLEHISPFDTQETLWEWWRVLKSGGVLNILVPDFNMIAEAWLAGNLSRKWLLRYLYCPVLHSNRQMPHLNMFDAMTLKKLLEEEDFTVGSIEHESLNVRMIAVKN